MAKKLEYQALLEEEKLTLEDLPMEIRKRINVLKPLIAKFNDNPTDKMKQAIIKNDIEIAEMIADFVEKDLPEQNENEDDDDDNNGKKSNNRQNDNDDDDDENDDNKSNIKKANKPAAKTPEQIEAEKAARQAEIDKAAEEKIAAKAKADKEAAEKKAADDKEAAEEEQRKKDAAKVKITDFGTLEMEKKIIENCDKNNGFISEKDLISIIGKSADYPTQKVYSISLKKVFLKSLYQLL